MKAKMKLQNQAHEEQENDELWAISYGDMITLLLSFFVIFFSTDFKKNQDDKIDNNFITNFKMLDLKMDKKYPPQESKQKGNLTTIEDAPKFDLLKNAKITKLNDRLLITFDQMNFFDTAETNPTKDSESILKELATKFIPYSSVYKMEIKAFTDKRPVKGNHRYADNMELSALRAISSMRILQKAGVPLNKMEIAGNGEMSKLSQLITPEKLKEMKIKEIQDISRTLIIIIKHDNEKSVL